jgi:hypothetical protein
LKNNFNQKKIHRHLNYINSKIEEYQTQLNQNDNKDKQAIIQDKIEYQNTKKERHQLIEFVCYANF